MLYNRIHYTLLIPIYHIIWLIIVLSFLKNKLKKLTCFNNYLKKRMKKEKLLTRKNYIQQYDQLTDFTIFLQNYLNLLDLITNG